MGEGKEVIFTLKVLPWAIAQRPSAFQSRCVNSPVGEVYLYGFNQIFICLPPSYTLVSKFCRSIVIFIAVKKQQKCSNLKYS